ncbi:MAG TPA: DUF1007 family protein, partial [Xanthobacteraceae bacterium]|nr:DUF1007 family protein [Xanthobacteraceae bacterium]
MRVRQSAQGRGAERHSYRRVPGEPQAAGAQAQGGLSRRRPLSRAALVTFPPDLHATDSTVLRTGSEVLLARALLIALAVLGSATAAIAHPHVWVTVRSELDYRADGALAAVKHAWTFDEG